jgi:hypothetical protein
LTSLAWSTAFTRGAAFTASRPPAATTGHGRDVRRHILGIGDDHLCSTFKPGKTARRHALARLQPV